jgi:hypothetical protein
VAVLSSKATNAVEEQRHGARKHATGLEKAKAPWFALRCALLPRAAAAATAAALPSSGRAGRVVDLAREGARRDGRDGVRLLDLLFDIVALRCGQDNLVAALPKPDAYTYT